MPSQKYLFFTVIVISVVLVGAWLFYIEGTDRPPQTSDSEAIPSDARPAASWEPAQRKASPSPSNPIVGTPLGQRDLYQDADLVPGTELAAAERGGRQIRLVYAGGSVPFVRIEAQTVIDPDTNESRLVSYDPTAGDRVDVRLHQADSNSSEELRRIAEALGASVNPRGNDPLNFQLVWRQPELDTVPLAIKELRRSRETIALADPVDFDYEHPPLLPDF